MRSPCIRLRRRNCVLDRRPNPTAHQGHKLSLPPYDHLMRIYADDIIRRSRQIIADVLGILWCVGALIIAWGIYFIIELLGRPGEALEDAGTGMAGNLRNASDRLQDVPLVGDPAASPLEGAAGAADRLADAGQSMQDTARLIAIIVALLFLAAAFAAAALVWVLPRLLWVRRAREAQAVLATSGGVELLAMRALVRRRLSQLAKLDGDIVAAWRRAEPAALRDLAALELRRLGLHPPSAPASTDPET